MDVQIVYSPAPGPSTGTTLTSADIADTGVTANGSSGTSITQSFNITLTAGQRVALGLYAPGSGVITPPAWLTEDVTEGNTTWFFGTATGGETEAAFTFASSASARFIIYAVVDNAGSISHGYGAGSITLPATGTYTFTNDTSIPAGSLRMAMTWKFAAVTATADSVVGGSIYRNWFSSRFLWLSQDDQSGTSDTLEVSMDTDVTANNVSTVIFSP